ncbi:50S ribosomal protein L18 [Balneolaceae bacterium ANBcel3]|nr:50S ribosomal protein L18 [Balneolaceae bacterium ANBcel3]
MSNFSKTARRKKIRLRVRKKITGTAERPRLCVFKSSKHVYAQLIDDQAGVTIAASSTLSKELKDSFSEKSKMEVAEMIGKYIGEKAKEKGITKAVFDRSGYKYHGIVKNVAEGARKGGLQF